MIYEWIFKDGDSIDAFLDLRKYRNMPCSFGMTRKRIPYDSLPELPDSSVLLSTVLTRSILGTIHAIVSPIVTNSKRSFLGVSNLKLHLLDLYISEPLRAPPGLLASLTWPAVGISNRVMDYWGILLTTRASRIPHHTCCYSTLFHFAHAV